MLVTKGSGVGSSDSSLLRGRRLGRKGPIDMCMIQVRGLLEKELNSCKRASMVMSVSKLWKIVEDREAWHAAVHGVENRQAQLKDWTTTAKQAPRELMSTQLTKLN